MVWPWGRRYRKTFMRSSVGRSKNCNAGGEAGVGRGVMVGFG